MILTQPILHTIEQSDRRVLGAVRCVDAVTQLPVNGRLRIEIESAALTAPPAEEEIPVAEGSVRVQQTRSGLHAFTRAPFFQTYSETFVDPQNPPELAGRQLRLRVSLTELSGQYLPQRFQFELPRSLNRQAGDAVHQPVVVPLYRAPGAAVVGGWSILRTRVIQAGTGLPLPGVLVRVFAHPRAAASEPIGEGMTEWRGNLRGEGLVAVLGIPRFRPGAGENVFETAQEIQLEAIRDTNFTGAGGQFPFLPAIRAGVGAGIIVRRSDPPAPPSLAVLPATPFAISAGQETAIQLTMS
jgi:hypothetical protein